MNNILIIDDDDDIQIELISISLKNSGFNVITAMSGRQGIAYIKANQVDVILLDINMPVMNGFDVIDHLNADDDFKNIPVIMVTSDSGKDSVIKAMEYGVFDYIRKPVDNNRLATKIKAAFKYQNNNISKDQEAIAENNKNVLKRNKKNFTLTRSQGRTVIELDSGFDRLSAIPQLKNTFNSILLGELKKELCILDIRAIISFSDELYLGIRKIISTLHGIHIYIICGRHFDEMKQKFEISELLKLFISYGDFEIYRKKHIQIDREAEL